MAGAKVQFHFGYIRCFTGRVDGVNAWTFPGFHPAKLLPAAVSTHTSPKLPSSLPSQSHARSIYSGLLDVGVSSSHHISTIALTHVPLFHCFPHIQSCCETIAVLDHRCSGSGWHHYHSCQTPLQHSEWTIDCLVQPDEAAKMTE